MRILVLENIAQWTGDVVEHAYLEIPPTMNMADEEKSWFANGGGTLSDFVCYLKKKGAKELTNVETWTINYQ